MRSKQWRERPIRDLEALLIPPLLAGQFSLAEAQSKANGPITKHELAPVAVLGAAT